MIEYRNGNESATVRKLPGLIRYNNIVLKRGFTKDTTLWDWFKKVLNGKTDRRSGSITLLAEDRSAVARWNLPRSVAAQVRRSALQRHRQRGRDRDAGACRRTPRARDVVGETARPKLHRVCNFGRAALAYLDNPPICHDHVGRHAGMRQPQHETRLIPTPHLTRARFRCKMLALSYIGNRAGHDAGFSCKFNDESAKHAFRRLSTDLRRAAPSSCG